MSLKHQIKELTGRDVYVPEYEEIKKSDRVNSARRATYVERNYWMIDDGELNGSIHFHALIYIPEGEMICV